MKHLRIKRGCQLLVGLFAFMSCLFSSEALLGQELPKGNQVFTTQTDLAQVTITGEALEKGNTVEVANPGLKYRVVEKTKEGNYIIRFLKFTNNENLNAKLYGTDEAPKYFVLPKSAFESFSEPQKSRWDFAGGIITTPIKFRPSRKDSLERYPGFKVKRDFDLVTNLNIGTAVGPKYRLGTYGRLSEASISLLFGASIGAIYADSASTNGKFRDASTDLFGATLHVSAVFEFHEFQAIISLGKDYLGGEIGKNWTYQAAPWIGIGIGKQIFEAQKTGTKDTNKPG